MSQVTLQQAIELAIRQFQSGNAKAAGEICTQILQAYPNYPPAVHLLGVIALQAADYPAAERHLRQAIKLAPQAAEFHNNLGVLLRSLGKQDEAVAEFRAALALKGDYSDAMSNLGGLLGNMGHLSESISLNRKAAELRPGCDTLNNHGNALMRQGKVADAIAAYRKALTFSPDDAKTWSNLLLTSHYDPAIPRKALAEEHLRWGRRMAELVPPADHPGGRDPDRRLRVGYLSPDFRAHSVCYFVLPVLEHHDHAGFDIFIYSSTASEDDMTARVRSAVGADRWRAISGLPDARIVEMIRQDKIDILIDLAGHTAKNRLPLLARKPAPVQIAYLGYPNTTGLAAIDARFTDSIADPPGESDELSAEKLIRLDPCAWCFWANPKAPIVAPPPVAMNDYVTFGSFNALTKVSEPVIEAWSRILHAVKDARLAIKCGAFADPPTKEETRQRFIARGVAAERLDFSGHVPEAEQHLAAYARLDVALDTLHYNGTTTTCEALWMGVPVVTMRGASHAARVGASLLRCVGLEELVSEDVDGYVKSAVAMSCDHRRLAEIRATMRERLRRSPLLDAAAMARRIEAAYRQLWRLFAQNVVRLPGERK